MTVLLAVLGAAVLHAAWNAMAHGVPDRLGGFALLALSSGACAVVAIAITGLPPAKAWPYIIASVVVHLAYYGGLVMSYNLGQFSQVYPLARGTSPWVVAVVAVVVLNQHLMPLELAGVLLISAGLIALVFIGGRPKRHQAPALLAAFGTGLLIAAYTVVDGVAVRKVPLASYMGWTFTLQNAVLILFVLWRRGLSFLRVEKRYLYAGLAGGLVSLAAYSLVLWAQTRGALAAVAALRETSIIFGAIIGALFFGERFGPKRALAATVVVAGITLITLA
ncbi:DMT family transporter [Kribbella monticola]|uniref:DMT family transporter n=1 Tax=Kribbella monticola TaxID=2185285 RepID=UPI0018E51E1C|nr:DMT family transporter [Kribbella monticola]